MTLELTQPLLRFKLRQIVWNDWAMGVTETSSKWRRVEGQEGAEFISTLPKEVRDKMYITMETREGVAVVETVELVNARKGGQREGVELEGAEGVGRV